VNKRIRDDITTVSRGVLAGRWEELEFRVDATWSVHIEPR
jgi:hypothetical protein